jgi:hypothetical protein
VLIVTGFGIFALLKALGYLNVPLKGISARRKAAAMEAANLKQEGESSGADDSTPWQNGAENKPSLTVAQSSSD